MGVFHDMVTVINLAPIPLSVTFDGQTTKIPVGESQIPRVTVNYAKNQNPVPGSADMTNPSISGAQYMISVKGYEVDRQTPFTREEWEAFDNKPSRWNVDDHFADQLGPKEHVVIRGTKAKNKVQAKSSFDAGVRVHSPETFTDNS
jgi:hypothetical protein